MLRFLFPYLMLAVITATYLYIRYSKLGPVMMKVNRSLLSRYNSDSFILIIIIMAVSYFLGRYELQTLTSPEGSYFLGLYTYVFFYGVLFLIVILREFERPALRERGISTPRGFWKWSEVDAYRWSKNVLTINISRGNKKRMEVWQLEPDEKKEIEAVLKSNIKKKSKQSKKKNS